MSYKHFENEFLKMTLSKDDVATKKDDGVVIKTDLGEFTFYPNREIRDHMGDVLLYVKFNHKEHLILCYMTDHPESRRTFHAFQMVVLLANKMKGENYVVRNLMDYLDEIGKVYKELERGDIEFKDGIHPDMKKYFDEGDDK